MELVPPPTSMWVFLFSLELNEINIEHSPYPLRVGGVCRMLLSSDVNYFTTDVIGVILVSAVHAANRLAR